MASGKQLSFAFGEVSPSLRFRADAQFYSQALSKAVNANARKSGGMSNRPGTKLLTIPQNQDYIPTKASSAVGIRLFPFSTISGGKYQIELRNIIIEETPGVYSCPIRLIEVTDQVITETDATWSVASAASAANIADNTLLLSKASISQLGDSAIITCPLTFAAPAYGGNDIIFRIYPGAGVGDWEVDLNLDSPEIIGGPAAAMSALTITGSAPLNIPVNYKIMQELDDGSELLWSEAGYPLGGHPHANASSRFTFDADNTSGIKQYNIYRSAGSDAGTPASHYALVGRVPPTGSAAQEFRDYLVSPDITIQPPTDTYLVPHPGHIRKIAYYKERLILAYSAYLPTGATVYKHIEGQLCASKLGSPLMLNRPLTPNQIDAFSFTIPNDKIGIVTNTLVMNKLIIFTKNYTFAIRGGVGGVLTSSEVNPEKIYDDGCSNEVNPVGSGNKGYFVNSDKTKLLMIKCNRDDAIDVTDISTLSDHLFEARDIRSMVLMPGIENILWIVKKDGTLISVTISEESGVVGFSRHNTDGFVEDIMVQDQIQGFYYPDQDTTITIPMLFLSVIRNGVRVYETMYDRNDILQNRFLYADSSKFFGSYKPEPNYLKAGRAVNITTSSDYLAGSTLTISEINSDSIFTAQSLDSKFDFSYYYFDENGDQQRGFIRITPIALVNAYTITGYSEYDLPEELQDITNKVGLSSTEKQDLQSWWTEAVIEVTGLEHLAGKEVSVYADGQVISSPNNPAYDTLVVSPVGTLALPDYYSYGYVGLPYTTEIETLDIEASDARTFTDVGKLINGVGLGLHRSSGGFVGQTGQTDTLNMEDLGSDEKSGYLKVQFPSSWEQTGRVLVKQVDPLPMSVLSIYPKGVAGE